MATCFSIILSNQKLFNTFKLYEIQLFKKKSVQYKLRRVATELLVFDLEVKVDLFIVHLAFLF